MSNLRHAVRDAKDLPTAVEAILSAYDLRGNESTVADLEQLLGGLHLAYEAHLQRIEQEEPTVVGIETDNGVAYYEV